MHTGYYIKSNSIYGPAGYTGYRINRRRQIIGRQGYTRHWIHRDNIFSSLEGNTGYWIDKDQIMGPSNDLPWEQKQTQRVARGKAKGKQGRTASGSP
jgi:hypothetical protein